MPVATDVVRTNIITELSGVAMNSTLFWEVEDVGNDDPVDTNLTKLATAYRDAVTAAVSTGWAVTCITYFNESMVEPKVVLPITLAGTGIGDSHPQHAVVRMNRYGLFTGDQTTRRGAHNLSGVIESLSSNGRINDMSEFVNLEAFLANTLILPTGGWTLAPQIQITPDPLFPLVQQFILASEAQANATFQVLSSRKTKLCGTV